MANFDFIREREKHISPETRERVKKWFDRIDKNYNAVKRLMKQSKPAKQPAT